MRYIIFSITLFVLGIKAEIFDAKIYFLMNDLQELVSNFPKNILCKVFFTSCYMQSAWWGINVLHKSLDPFIPLSLENFFEKKDKVFKALFYFNVITPATILHPTLVFRNFSWKKKLLYCFVANNISFLCHRFLLHNYFLRKKTPRLFNRYIVEPFLIPGIAATVIIDRILFN